MSSSTPIVHIEDINNKLELKVFENKTMSDIDYLEFVMSEKNGTTISFGLEEKNAALLFEGLCQIFENDNSEYRRDCDACATRKNSTTEYNELDKFFEILEEYNEKYF